MRYTFLSLMTLLFITACSVRPDSYLQQAKLLANTSGLKYEKVKSNEFNVATFHKGLDEPFESIHIYLEGDGKAWVNRHQLSSDPTPANPVALKLAIADKHPAILYIARPCQYLLKDNQMRCKPEFWSSHRYSQMIIDVISEVMDKKVINSKKPRLGLIGYSGGGAIALLLAAKRNDISWVVTVAGLLDHKVWTTLHKVSPLEGSLNPVNFVHSLKKIRQLHLVGGKDRIVPLAIAKSYMENFAGNNRVNLQIESDYDHHCCWSHTWQESLSALRKTIH